MRSPDVVIRPPATARERDAFFQLAAAQFIRDPPPRAASDLRRYVTEAPGTDPIHLRAAFLGDTYAGGYRIDERWMRLGPAKVRAGCVGVVITDPDHRRQGIATALMEDAIAFARARRHALLLLHGKPDFYTRFGYVDVFDATNHVMDCVDILALAPSPYRLRAATDRDLVALHGLYDRHYAGHPGSFARTIEQHAFQIRFALSVDHAGYRQRDETPFHPPLVAVDHSDRVRGYSMAPWGPLWPFGSEVAADDWPAILALLQHHARALQVLPAPPAELRWPLPPDGLVAQLLADQLQVRCERIHRPRAGWMARLVDLDQLVEPMAPIWWERLRAGPTAGPQGLSLNIDDVYTVELASEEARVVACPTCERPTIRLTSAGLLPLLFGYRTTAWAACQPAQEIPLEAIPMFEALFPSVQPCVPPTDGC